MCAMKSTMPFVDRGDIEKVKLCVDKLVSGRDTGQSRSNQLADADGHASGNAVRRATIVSGYLGAGDCSSMDGN